MTSAARMIAIGLMVSAIFISACFLEKNYGDNFATPNHAPVGFYDQAKYEKGVFTGIGWSADKEDNVPLKMVLVYVDGKPVGEAKFQMNREDVVNVYKNDRWLKSGWQVSASIPLGQGPHTSLALCFDSKDALLVLNKEFIVR